MRCLRLLILALAMVALAAGGFASAAEKDLKLVVKAGQYDRANTPVCVPVDAPEGAKSVAVTLPGGKQVSGQLTAPGLLDESAAGKRELHFILPELKKGESAEATVAFSDKAPDGPQFFWKNVPDQYAELRFGQGDDSAGVLRYICAPYDESTPERRHDTFKVYHHVFSPSGDRMITKGPGGLYTHHRGLFFGYCHCTLPDGKIDTWGCGNGHQVHAGFSGEEAGPVLGRHCVAVDWRANKEQKTFVKEQRELTAYRLPGGNLIEFATLVNTAGGPVKLDGNAPHAGFQFRADQEVAEKNQKQTYYLRPDGKGQLGAAVASAKDLAWDALSFVLGDRRYTVLYLDKPTNPKPAEYNERTYGRFGSYFVAELAEGKPLRASYRVWVQDAEMTGDQAEALSEDFVKPVEVEVKGG
jgi:hypothetical protein